MDVQVVVQGGQGYLTGVPGSVMQEIQEATRFRPQGFQFSPKFNRFVPKSGGGSRRMWDGYVKLTKHSKFPAGLLDRVLEVLNNNHIQPKVIMERPPDLAEVHMELAGIEERDYQNRAVEKALLSARGILRAPTGSGKSAIAARIIVGKGRRALVIVPTIDLLHQMKDFLNDHIAYAGGSIGQLGDGVVDPQEITVATVRTAAKVMSVSYESYEFGEYDDKDPTEVNANSLRNWVAGIGTVIVDEAHILGAQVIYDLVTKMNAPNKFGMSASPWRDDGADLMIEAATGKPLYRIGTAELVRDGWLVPPIIRVVPTKGMWRPAAWDKNEYQKAYAKEIVENPVRNQFLADTANSMKVPTLMLVKQIKHGRILEGLTDGALFLSGKASSDERNKAYADMRAGNLKVIIATTIADLGLDLPICAGLVLAGGGKSSTRHLQRIGRAARPYPGKQSALVVDPDDSHVHDWFKRHARARRKIERAEWGEVAIWI